MKELDHVNPLKDKSNPLSVINLTPSSVSKSLELIPDDVFMMTETELKDAGRVTQYEEMLRIAFWKEYDSSIHAKRNIVLSNIYGGVCNQHYFLKKVVANSFRLAYILTLPKNYEVEMTDIQSLANARIREMLTLPLIDAKGNYNGHLGNTIHKIWETSLDRVRGSVVTRNESRNLTTQINLDQAPKEHDQLSLEEIEARLALVEAKTPTDISTEEEFIDVESEPRNLADNS